MLASLPAVVVLPSSTAQVQWCVQQCVALGLPYTARGAGTGLSGGGLALKEGVLISLARMNQVLAFEPHEHRVLVQAGLANAALNAYLAAEPRNTEGLYYAPDPSSQVVCTLGGNWAENAGGVHCVKYGMTVDHVLGLQWVTPKGEVVETSAGTNPYAAGGVNWNALLVGSEGTLGLLTQAWLALHPKAPHTAVALLAFDALEAAADAVNALFLAGLDPAAVELIDALTVQCVNRTFNVGLPQAAQAVLLVELDAFSAEQLALQQQRLTQAVASYHPSQQRWATTAAAMAQLWQARKGAVASYGQLAPAFYIMDPVIPRQAVGQALLAIGAIAQQHGLRIANVFHAGDGNLHPHLFYDPYNPQQVAAVHQAAHAIMHLCLQLGGTLSGEHGIGWEKVGYMPQAFSPASLEPMYWVQAALDASGLCNPTKLLPAKRFCGEGASSCQHGLSHGAGDGWGGLGTTVGGGTTSQALTQQGLWV
jgi:glycolate oxidase